MFYQYIDILYIYNDTDDDGMYFEFGDIWSILEGKEGNPEEAIPGVEAARELNHQDFLRE